MLSGNNIWVTVALTAGGAAATAMLPARMA